MFYIHKYTTRLEYGGPEEGGWWYDSGVPVERDDWEPRQHAYDNEETAYSICRGLNELERERREREEDFDYHSVLAYRSTHYAYLVEDAPTPVPFPLHRPRYE